MAIRVTVATDAGEAIVLCYPRDERGDAVAGESWTEIARLPANSRQDFLLGPDRDLLIAAADAPAPGAEAASASAGAAEMREAG